MLLLYRVGKILGVDAFGVFGLGDDFLHRSQGVIVGRQPAQVIGAAGVVAPTGCRVTPGVLGVRDSSAPRTSAKVITWARPSPGEVDPNFTTTPADSPYPLCWVMAEPITQPTGVRLDGD